MKTNTDTKKWFAELGGCIMGVEQWIRFEAETQQQAEDIAEFESECNYSAYGETVDENGCPEYSYDLAEYDPEKHDEYFTHMLRDSWEILHT